MKRKLLVTSIGVLLGVAALPASAVTDEEGNAAIQFNFVPPGARSLGMAGAFLGRADDATAAYTNPAGLTQLVSFEVGAEGRHISSSTEFASGGSFAIDPFDISGVDYDSADDSVNSLAYLSFVWVKDNWRVALYRHELIKYETSYSAAEIPLDGFDFAILPYDVDMDLDAVNYGLSAAYKVSDSFSLGASLIWSDFEIDSTTSRPTALTPFSTSQSGEDDDVAFNVGALWRINPQWQAGIVYRDGPEFSYDADLFVTASGERAPGFPKSTEFNAPDLFGLGLSYQPSANWTFTFDVNRVYYSDLTDGLNSGFRANDGDDLASIRPLKIDDGTEWRLGGEYTFIDMTNPLSLRAGVWRDPEHTIRFRGAPDLTDPNTNAIGNAVIFSTGDDEMHYSLGLGVAFGNFSFDVAADFSDPVDIISVSGVLRFD